MVHNTAKLGGAASDVVVGKVAVSHVVQLNGPLSQTFYSFQLARQSQHGLMMMTVKPTPVPDEEAFAAIKAGIDALPPGAKMFLNSGECGPLGHHHLAITPEHRKLTRPHVSGEFYGQGASTANLELVARFFEKYPGYADRAFLSVKGGTLAGQLQSDGSRENLRRSVDAILKALRGTKRLDLFEPARRDTNYEIEQYAESLNEMVKEGKFDYIGLSEVGAETVRRAHKVSTTYPSVWCSSALCGELGYARRGGRDRSEPSG